MRSIIGWLAAFVLGYFCWWLGAKLGPVTGVLLSAVGTGVGLWAGFRWFDQNLR